MDIYLPVVELSINFWILVNIGIFAGILSGIFGIGGGFLVVPILIFMGVPPSIATISSINQLIATSFAGSLIHYERKNIDFQMAQLLLIGSITGSILGIGIYNILSNTGHLDVVVSCIYTMFLFIIGSLMLFESLKKIFKFQSNKLVSNKSEQNFKNLPFQKYFEKSDVTVSILLPIGIGIVAGLFISLLGVGANFIVIPAMIYLLSMKSAIVLGTSLFQMFLTSVAVIFLYILEDAALDIVLSAIIIIGSVTGSIIGMKLATKLSPNKSRLLLALIILAVSIKMGNRLFTKPETPYSVSILPPQ